MEAKSVKLERAWAWFEGGWQVFARIPVRMLVLVLLYTVVGAGAVVVSPYAAVVWLLWPYLYGGTFCLLRGVQQGEGARLRNLLKPFAMPGVRLPLFGLALLTVGLYLFLGTASVTMVYGAKFAMASTPGLWEHIGAVVTVLAGLVSCIFVVLIQLLTLYAAPLVISYGVGPLQALATSFRACSKNWQAFLVFGCVIGLVLFALAVLLLFLGWIAIGAIKASNPMAAMGGVAAMMMRPSFLSGSAAVVCLLGVPLVTVVFCAIYASYTELFQDK